MKPVLALIAVALLSLLSTAVAAQVCAQEVLKNLYADLESIDTAGEKRLADSLDALSAQEQWSDAERRAFTLTIADNPETDKAEARRTEILASIFGLAQQGGNICAEIRGLRDEVLALERAQWDHAVRTVTQRLWR